MKAIEEFPEYKISEHGVVYNRHGKVMKYGIDKDGYHDVGLSDNNRRSWRRIHRLVSAAYIPNPDNKPQVNHKDGDKTNNHVSNLEWCTDAENKRHAWDNGLYTPPSKEHMKAIKAAQEKKVAMVDLDGNIVATFSGTREAARILGKPFDYTCISKVALGQRKMHAGYSWKYINS